MNTIHSFQKTNFYQSGGTMQNEIDKQMVVRGKKMLGHEIKRILQIFAIVSCVLLVGIFENQVMAYTIDGKVDDWGINLFAASKKGNLDRNLPSGSKNIDVITEDNAANNIIGWQYVGPGWSYYGNDFDVEAIYFDNDQSFAYIAIVQGLPISGGTAPNNPWLLPGDIGIDVNLDGKYEYGIEVNYFQNHPNEKKTKFYEDAVWKDVRYPAFSKSNPWRISSGQDDGLIDFVYSGNQNNHYVMEAAIPLNFLDLTANPGDSVSNLRVHWTQECGNDSLILNATVNPAAVPEPGTMFLLGTGLLGLGRRYLRRRCK